MDTRKRNRRAIAVYLGLMLIAALFIFWSDRSDGDLKYLLMLASFTPILIGALFVINIRLPGGIQAIYINKNRIVFHYCLGILFGALQFLAFVGVSLLFRVNTVARPAGPIAWGMIMLFAVAFVGQTALEEVLARGVILQVMSKRTNLAAGVIVSSVIFSALHIPNGSVTWLSLLNLFLIGCFFCLLVIGSHSLYFSGGAHFAWNLFESNVFSAANSNNEISSGIFKLTPVSNSDLLTGGNFGPEASVLTTIIVLVSIAICLVFIKVRQDRRKN